MNIFELAIVLVIVGSGFVVGNVFGHRWGIWGSVGGALLGLSLACVGLALFRRMTPFNWFPTCLQGKCGVDDYRFVEKTTAGSVFVCKCGAKYILAGSRFMAMSTDGSLHPYMIRRKRGGRWEPDSGTSDPKL